MDGRIRKIEPGKPFRSILHFDDSVRFHLISQEFLFPKGTETTKRDGDKGEIIVAKMNSVLGMRIVLHGVIERDGVMLPWDVEFAPTGVQSPDTRGHEEA